MNNRLWQQAHQLAAECAQRDMDVSLLRNAAAYLQENREADFADWLLRLVWLGPLFKMSEQTEQHRRDLWMACTRLSPPPENIQDWLEVLHWAARLYGYYREQPQEARQRIRIEEEPALQPPPRPAKWQTKKKQVEAVPNSSEAQELLPTTNEFYARFFGSAPNSK